VKEGAAGILKEAEVLVDRADLRGCLKMISALSELRYEAKEMREALHSKAIEELKSPVGQKKISLELALTGLSGLARAPIQNKELAGILSEYLLSDPSLIPSLRLSNLINLAWSAAALSLTDILNETIPLLNVYPYSRLNSDFTYS